ncbi:hypothetical protein F511_26821 [Dorcoceras hygrometricum]|uniref:Uncharacterized protein n=1 Tax=Dorcoceras hygrometricum TaxID=472368 RepID=A0A2Z7BKE4_9LAMI|nr:hypothetical protein F511_26821 [Dorcoceras hygrometricum]
MSRLVQQFTSRSAGNTKLVHQLEAGAARRSSAELPIFSRYAVGLRIDEIWGK